VRTKRSVALTEAGTRFLASMEPALADIDKAAEDSADRGEVTGLMRINVPRIALKMALPKARLAAPAADRRNHSDDAMIDIVATPASGSARLCSGI
jgi:DNA-binding transcriptional LysR family regulator